MQSVLEEAPRISDHRKGTDTTGPAPILMLKKLDKATIVQPAIPQWAFETNRSNETDSPNHWFLIAASGASIGAFISLIVAIPIVATFAPIAIGIFIAIMAGIAAGGALLGSGVLVGMCKLVEYSIFKEKTHMSQDLVSAPAVSQDIASIDITSTPPRTQGARFFAMTTSPQQSPSKSDDVASVRSLAG